MQGSASAASGRLYFAYGSNLSLGQMADRCPGALPVRAHVLHGFRLAFVGEGTQRWGRGGVATVLAAPESSVHGALYRISAEHEQWLDGFEGVAAGSYYRDTRVVSAYGEQVLTYVAADPGAENMPSAKYLAVIRQGYVDWGLPLEALADLAAHPS